MKCFAFNGALATEELLVSIFQQPASRKEPHPVIPSEAGRFFPAFAKRIACPERSRRIGLRSRGISLAYFAPALTQAPAACAHQAGGQVENRN